MGWPDYEDFERHVKELHEYTGHEEMHAIYTVYLNELIETGVFDWSRPELDWKAAAYDDAQYERICTYFIERFRYREISLTPILEWMNILHRKLVFELMPKYKPLYARFDEGINPFQDYDEYHKSRSIDSSYPETLLSQNQDYISSGNDTEHETVREGNIVDSNDNYVVKFRSVDESLLDELESMFTCMYSAYVNGL